MVFCYFFVQPWLWPLRCMFGAFVDRRCSILRPLSFRRYFCWLPYRVVCFGSWGGTTESGDVRLSPFESCSFTPWAPLQAYFPTPGWLLRPSERVFIFWGAVEAEGLSLESLFVKQLAGQIGWFTQNWFVSTRCRAFDRCNACPELENLWGTVFLSTYLFQAMERPPESLVAWGFHAQVVASVRSWSMLPATGRNQKRRAFFFFGNFQCNRGMHCRPGL